MIKKDKLDFKLINLALLALVVYLMYHTGHLWIGIFDKIVSICLPFILGFAVAYSVHPLVQRLRKRKVPKGLAVAIIILAIFLLLFFMIYVVSTTCVSQISALLDSINAFIKELSSYDLNINISGLQETINQSSKEIINGLTKYVSDGAINLVSSSVNFIGNFLIGVAAFIYFLLDMDKIRTSVKHYFKKKSYKTYHFVRILDEQMRNYLAGLVQVMVISVFEYGIVYAIIGHPNAIMLGIMAGVANLIPYFGGLACNVVAAITAFITSPALFVRTLIAFFILSSIDSYVINPHVYGKTNSIHPLLTIFALFAGGIIFGMMGVLISFPLAIFIVSLYKYYKDDISEGIEKIKESGRKGATN